MAAKHDSERKAAIRERYKGVDPSKLEVRLAKVPETVSAEERTLNVAAYIRVSTENDEQTSSFELQQNDFTERIQANPNWHFVGIYADEGISGTELSHRKGMLQMLEDCRAGKIDYILAKSIARFARNVVDCLSIIEELKNMNPPVGVYFEADNLYTLDSTGALVLTIMATLAEEESRNKSVIMNWSIEKRFSRGLFLIQKLLGYDKDEDGNLVINPEEAETVKVIYNLYVNGWSCKEIADLLTAYGRKTKLGNTVWNSGSITGVIENERHCGDVIARKTFTPNFKNHKAKKNVYQRNQYTYRDHHEPIVSRSVFNAANLLRSSQAYRRRRKPLPVLSVIDDGILRGYVPIDKDWRGFSTEDYRAACQSVGEGNRRERYSGKRLNMSGFQIVRSEFFPSAEAPALTISKGKLRFNTACLRKFKDVEFVELLLNTTKNCIAIRPCKGDNPNAIRWGRLKNEKWIVSTVCAKGLSQTLTDLLGWESEARYRCSGRFVSSGNDKLLLFELDEPVVTNTVTQIVVPEQPEENEAGEREEIVVKEKIRTVPPSWITTFGEPIAYIVHANILERKHFAGEWDVLRPAREMDEINILSADQLSGLMREAESIMEGWKAS